MRYLVPRTLQMWGGSKESSVAKVFLRDVAEQTAIEIDVQAPEIAEHFAAAGEWNRFEGTIRGDLLSLTLNGQQFFEARQLAGAPETGALAIEAAGPIVANVYVRDLK